MKYKRQKATFGILAPNIKRGGMAIPLGNNLYWMKGRKHKTGGIDIGKDLEVENNEVMQMLPNETRVFSSVKMLGGNSPAELVASGMNPNMVFNAQEAYKKINRIKDDGSRYKRGGRKRAKEGTNEDEINIDLPGLTVYQPIQKEIPNFIEQAIYETGSKLEDVWNIPGMPFTEDAFDIIGRLRNDERAWFTENGDIYKDEPLKYSVIRKVLDENETKFAINAFGELVPKSVIMDKARELEHAWRMKNDRAYRDKIEHNNETYEQYYDRMQNAPIASNVDLDKEMAWQYDQNDLDKQQIEKNKADRFAAQQHRGLTEAFAAPFYVAATIPGLATIPAAVGPFLAAHDAEAIAGGALGGFGLLGGLLYGADKHDQYTRYKDRIDEINSYLNTPWVRNAVEQARRNPEKSRAIMSQIRFDWILGNREKYKNGNLPIIEGLSVGGDGTPQNAFLLDRDVQRDYMLNHGYIETPGDYGLVRKSVGDRDIPVYQQMPDVITRDKLTPIGNLFNYAYGSDTNPAWLANSSHLEHAGDYPTALYVDKDGNFYQKAWDLNDYGGVRQGIDGVGLDLVGNPVVVTTGFQPVDKSKILELEHNNNFEPTEEWEGALSRLKQQSKKYGGKQMNLQNIGNPLARYGKRKVYRTIKGAKAHWEINERGEKVLVPNNTIEYGGGQFSGSGAGASWGDEETVEPKTNQLDVIPLPESRTFNEAYSAARREKKKTFMFNGKEYSTAYSPNVQNWRQAGDSRVEVTGYGLGARWRKPLGGIVRFDGAGRDRLAYIPFTRSSKQDMKCGGRVKAESGLSWGYYPPKDDLLFGEDIDYNIGRDNTSYRVPLFANNDNRITGLRLPTLGYLRPSDTFLANWMARANANNRDGVVNTQEPYGYVPRYSHLRLDNSSGDNNTTGSWSQFLTNLDTPTLIDKRTHKTDGANVYSTKKSNSVSPQSTNGKGISSYLDIVNDITKGESDWQGYAAAGVNALGSVVNSLIMNNALRKQRPPVRPVAKIAQKLKTKYNIDAQLSEIRNELAGQINNVARNTASSHTLRNLYNNLGLASLIARNKLHEDKENKETELINKDIINRQTTDHENVDTYNKWLEARNDFYNNRSLLRAQNWASLVTGLGSAIGAGLGNIGASRRYRNNVLLAMLPYIKATGNG